MARRPQPLTTRDAILDAAVDLFIRYGFEASSMDAIAAAAGVAKGSLYYHYESKEGIVDAILDRYRRAIETRLAAIEADSSRGALDKVRDFGTALAEVNSATFSRLHRVRTIDIHQKTQAIQIHCFAPYLARLLAAGAESGAFRVAEPLDAAEILIAAASTLLDPELGPDALPRRTAAFARLTALVLGLDVSSLGPSLGLDANGGVTP